MAPALYVDDPAFFDQPPGEAHRCAEHFGDLGVPATRRAGNVPLIAGVHAVGSLGVAHYLSGHIAELYAEIGSEPFSMVVRCDFESETKRITSARPMSDVLRHEAA